MEYKGQEIGIPTLEMFKEYISRQKYAFPAEIAYKHFENKGWLSTQGQPLKSLEQAVNGYNGIFIYHQRQDNLYCRSLF